MRRPPVLPLLIAALFCVAPVRAAGAGPASVAGRVLDPSRQPVSGAVVSLRSSPGTVRQTTSRTDGSLAPIYVIEPVGLTFAYPTELLYDYDDEMLGDEDPEALELVTMRELGWDYLPDRKLDADDRTISVSLIALSAVTVAVVVE